MQEHIRKSALLINEYFEARLELRGKTLGLKFISVDHPSKKTGLRIAPQISINGEITLYTTTNVGRYCVCLRSVLKSPEVAPEQLLQILMTEPLKPTQLGSRFGDELDSTIIDGDFSSKTKTPTTKESSSDEVKEEEVKTEDTSLKSTKGSFLEDPQNLVLLLLELYEKGLHIKSMPKEEVFEIVCTVYRQALQQDIPSRSIMWLMSYLVKQGLIKQPGAASKKQTKENWLLTKEACLHINKPAPPKRGPGPRKTREVVEPKPPTQKVSKAKVQPPQAEKDTPKTTQEILAELMKLDKEKTDLEDRRRQLLEEQEEISKALVAIGIKNSLLLGQLQA